MDRIQNVDLQEAFEQIADNNTFFHRENDLGISFDQMNRAAKMNDPHEKTMIWISRPGGVDCYSEREAFQHNTRAHNGVLFHGFDMQSERKLAYAVTVSGVVADKLRGDITEIDIRAYAGHIKQNVLANSTVRLYLGDDLNSPDKQTTMSRQDFDQRFPVFGDHPKEFHLTYWRHEPDDMSRLYTLMDGAAKDREANSQPRDLWGHTGRLYDERYAFYAAEAVRGIEKLPSANSPDEQNFTIRLNAYIATAFGNNELGKLLDALPYKNASFIVEKGQPDMRVVIPRDEVLALRREQAAPPRKPSLLGRLTEATKEAAARQSAQPQAAKHKNAQMEV